MRRAVSISSWGVGSLRERVVKSLDLTPRISGDLCPASLLADTDMFVAFYIHTLKHHGGAAPSSYSNVSRDPFVGEAISKFFLVS